MLDLTVIILTFNEQLHIRRCLENVMPLARKVYVVDCHSTDGTQEIAREMGATVVEHDWPGNQAEQFNWALDSLPIDTSWVLRLDADEYLMPELVAELQQRLTSISEDVNGIVFKRRHIFLNRWMKRGTYPVKMIRLFRYGKGRSESRLMDEHIELTDGTTVEFDNDFVDHNLNGLEWFCRKHTNYAVREAAELLDLEYGLTGKKDEDLSRHITEQALAKRMRKHKYARQPLFWRSFAYFCYRYFFKLGFMEGKEGFLWHFLQGWWYRTLVDAKVLEIKRACGDDKEKIRAHLKEHYNISI